MGEAEHFRSLGKAAVFHFFCASTPLLHSAVSSLTKCHHLDGVGLEGGNLLWISLEYILILSSKQLFSVKQRKLHEQKMFCSLINRKQVSRLIRNLF